MFRIQRRWYEKNGGAERLFFGGSIRSMEEGDASIEAVATRGEKIIGVGTYDDCCRLFRGVPEKIDLRGRCLVPGFIDAHLHPSLMIYFRLHTDLKDVENRRELFAILGEKVTELGNGQWLVGLRVKDHLLSDPSVMTCHELDAVSDKIPIVIIPHNGHMVLGNSAALRKARVGRRAHLFPQELIDYDKHGQLTGVFREGAVDLLFRAIPKPGVRRLRRLVKETFDELVANGITSCGGIFQVGDEGPAGKQGVSDIPLMLAFEEHIRPSLYGIIITDSSKKMRLIQQTSLHCSSETAYRRIGGVKIFADGTLGGSTACMHEPYSDQSGKGFMSMTDEDMYRRMVDAHLAGFQIAIHAIGDAANRQCIELYRRLLGEYPREDHRHRIEHGSVLDAEMIKSIAELKLNIVVQPQFIDSEKEWLFHRLGDQRSRWVYPFRSLFDAGVQVVGSSDAPIESVNVIEALEACVTRHGFETDQCLSPEEALRMYTINGAYVQFDERIKGSIANGKQADLVVLSDDPLAVEPENIGQIKVEETYIRGCRAYPVEIEESSSIFPVRAYGELIKYSFHRFFGERFFPI